MDASRIRKKKFAFSQISGYVWTTPKKFPGKIPPHLVFTLRMNKSLMTDEGMSYVQKRILTSTQNHEIVNSCHIYLLIFV